MDLCGVYFLFLNEELVYIGSSKHIMYRLQTHLRNKEFDCFTYIETKPEDRLPLEEAYIDKFEPRLNKNLILFGYRSENWIRGRLKILGRRDLTNNLKKILKQYSILRNKHGHYSVSEFNTKLKVDLYAI